MTGRDEAAPNARTAMPGDSASVPPMVASSCWVSSWPASTVVAW